MQCEAMNEASSGARAVQVLGWQAVDAALRGIARRRAAMDSEEARWLREAEALQIWKPLGMVSAIDYMERVLGYAPRTAQERLRVARALGGLAKIDAALARGAIAFTAVRELTRVATAANEADWLAAAEGMNLRQIEELVADHKLGDGPSDPKDPEARTHVVRFELAAGTYATLRQVRQVLQAEREGSLSEDELVALLCEAALERAGDGVEEDEGRAKYQVAVTVCERCQQGWQEGAGVHVPVDASTVERAMCDAQHVGSLDGDGPERAHQDVTPSVARFVRRRDHGRCRVPGCRSARGIEIHHIVHREHGGGHEADNLILLCSSCHKAHHDGILAISGTAAELVIRRPGGFEASAAVSSASSSNAGCADAPCAKAEPRVGAKLDRAIAQARGAHVGAGDRGGNNRSAVLDRAVAHTGGAHVGAGDRGGNNRSAMLDRAVAHTGGAHVGAGDRGGNDRSAMRTLAQQALTTNGWPSAIASRAVADAAAKLERAGEDVDARRDDEALLVRLIFEAFRACPRRCART